MPPSHTPSTTTRLSRRLSQWICGVHGHDTQLQLMSDRLSLQCSHCGYVSPGWVVGQPARRGRRAAAPEQATPASESATLTVQ